MTDRNRRRRREGFTLIELMIVIAIIGVLAAIAVPNFRAARERANIRACYANQKTIAGAVEMYNLDFNQNLTSIPWNDLQANGYLQSVPGDPGYGPPSNSSENYQLSQGSGDGIYCTKHGAIREAGFAGS